MRPTRTRGVTMIHHGNTRIALQSIYPTNHCDYIVYNRITIVELSSNYSYNTVV
jgi:hypothetical protein